MDAPERGALMLVRFVAAALIGWTVLELALYILVCRNHNPPLPMQIFPCVLKSLPLIGGCGILFKAKSIAEWISEKLDL